MGLKTQLKSLADKINQLKDKIETEESTKHAFVLPFINLLGYDTFNPTEVVPEFTADLGLKKGEKVDYAKIQLPLKGKKVIQTFGENDMFILFKQEDEVDWNSQTELSQNLYRVQKIAGADYFMEICFRKHTDSRDDKNAKGDYVYIKGFGEGKTGWFTFNPIKVKISVSGKI